ncbi:hypothetical protein ACFC7A_15745 [Streptomyces niveus]|uniref:hypothetical protein n=1 Tax=Streptomyces niveus TaxID=193462 RepID=UPI0035E145D1
MTTPPTNGLLFEIPAQPTPVELLLQLADHDMRHNDMLDRLLRSGSQPAPARASKAITTRAAAKHRPGHPDFRKAA